MIGPGLSHASRNGSDANFSAKFDADTGLGIGVFEVMNELGHILDGVNIVVWWRADQADARRGVAQAGNVVVDLAARQLSAFTWLGALNDLDLQFVCIAQVVNRDAKTTTGHLLNGRALGVAIGKGNKALGVFATLTGI